jgi:hypothetical protein
LYITPVRAFAVKNRTVEIDNTDIPIAMNANFLEK